MSKQPIQANGTPYTGLVNVSLNSETAAEHIEISDFHYNENQDSGLWDVDIVPADQPKPVYDADTLRCIGKLYPPISDTAAASLQPWSRPNAPQYRAPHFYK